MKKLLFSLSTSVVLLSFAASADTLILTDPSGIPIPAGTHADSYLFPTSLLDLSNPITSLTVAYDAAFAPPGYHEIVSAMLLFDPAQVASISNVFSTPTYYGASVEFSVPVTAVSDEFAPAFWAVHGEIGGASLTELIWTVSYQDGSQRTAGDGIIPEPTTATLLFLTGLIFGCRSRRAG